MAAASASPLTPDQQYQIVAQASFLGDLKAKAAAVYAALEAQGAQVTSVGFTVDDVPVTLTLDGREVVVDVGTPAAPPAHALYSWRAPLAWILPTPAAAEQPAKSRRSR